VQDVGGGHFRAVEDAHSCCVFLSLFPCNVVR
jgi:hypothetical protein